MQHPWKLILIFLFCSCGSKGSETPYPIPPVSVPILEKSVQEEPSLPKTITWATNPQYPPYDWETEGVYKGAGPDILPLIIPKGYQLVAKMVPWPRAQEMARYGEIDLLLNIRITPQRSEYLIFAREPTFYNPICVFMKSEKVIPFKSWQELIPFQGGRAKGDTYGNGFDEFLSDHFQLDEANTMVENFLKLEADRIDFFPTGYFTGMAWLASAKMESRIKPLKPPVSNNFITLGFSKKSPYTFLLPQIEEKLKELRRKGTLDKLLESYLETFAQLPLEKFPH